MKRHNPRVVRLLALIAILGAALFPSAAFAGIGTACRFWGLVTVDGQNVPPGTVVTASVAGSTRLWTTTTFRLWTTTSVAGSTTFAKNVDSWYVVDIPEDDPATPEKDGAVAGDTVNFSVTLAGGLTILGSSPWQRMGFIYQPLRLTGGCIAGDANGDGVINIFDVNKVMRIILGQDDPTCGADANGDGSINIIDVITILGIILK